MTIYFDCNASTPVDPEVLEVVVEYLRQPGNAGSRTHTFGAEALQAVQRARDQVASVVGAERTDVIFTSGATEANNLAILGLRSYASATGHRHIISTAIEHKAILEPLAALEADGFEVTYVKPDSRGLIDAAAVLDQLRSDTALISVMHVNNETGVIQPIAEIASGLVDHDAVLHTDAAQGFGKELDALRHPRIDLISISGHKLYAPQGVGALIARKRASWSRRLKPLVFGGGQETGLRPGTVPVPLVAGLGKAAELAIRDSRVRREHITRTRASLLAGLAPLGFVDHCAGSPTLHHVINGHFPGIDSEAAMVALKGILALSNGSACTSREYTPSHVLEAMELPAAAVDGALRLSWCHLTPTVNWSEVVRCLESVRIEPITLNRA